MGRASDSGFRPRGPARVATTLPQLLRAWRLLAPPLPGATPRDRALACLGAFAGIALVALQGALVRGHGIGDPWIVAPIGASAVLLFAVPASPMAQPWPIIGGDAISAAVGLGVAHVIGNEIVGGALAVGLAIAAMSVTRCLHPPGGAAALTVVLGGPAVASDGAWIPLVPVAMNAAALVLVGWGWHRLCGRAYPHVAPPRPLGPAVSDPPPSQRVGLAPAELDAVLARFGETFDVERDDLLILLRELEERDLARERSDLTCAAIMSRDVLAVQRDADPADARRLLLGSGVRLLPVLDARGAVLGGVGLRELARAGSGDVVGDVMAEPLTIAPERSAIELTGPLTDGHRHAAMVVDGAGGLVGIVTQADLLAAIARPSGATVQPAPLRSSARSVVACRYPTCGAIWSQLSAVVRRRWTARSTRSRFTRSCGLRPVRTRQRRSSVRRVVPSAAAASAIVNAPSRWSRTQSSNSLTSTSADARWSTAASTLKAGRGSISSVRATASASAGLVRETRLIARSMCANAAPAVVIGPERTTIRDISSSTRG